MNDRHILVTGSSSGIGRAITEKLLAAGANVIGIARNPKTIKSTFGKYVTFEVDLSDLTNLGSSIEHILSLHPDLNGLVSNAGYGKFGGLESFSTNQISSFIDVNLVSHMIIAREIIPYFKKTKRGDIVLIGSEAALQGSKQGSLYCAAKFGLRGFSQAIRDECAGRGIRVSLVNPGMVRTSFFENLNFSPGDNPENAIESEDVASVVMNIFSARAGTVIDEVNLTPIKKAIKFL